jgi:hypothetical protein
MDEVENKLKELKKYMKQGDETLNEYAESLLSEIGNQLEHVRSFLTPTWIVPMPIQTRYLKLLKSYKHQLKKLYSQEITSEVSQTVTNI